MSGENAAVFGTFAGRANMEAAVDRLTAAGFSSRDVSILMSEDEAGHALELPSDIYA